jgi:flavin reductase (DIM6/NTAB) family NADH-FMN oxidoreductase RutF
LGRSGEEAPALSRHEEDQDNAGEPLVDLVDYPLFVVTAGTGNEVSGCLAGFVTQSSIEPVQFVVCISKHNHTYDTARRSPGLVVHLLGSDQRDVASLFGEATGDEVDKFTRVSWSVGRTGAPVLAHCAAWVEGRVIDRMDAGDHDAFLMKVCASGAGSHEGRFMLADASDFEPGHP